MEIVLTRSALCCSVSFLLRKLGSWIAVMHGSTRSVLVRSNPSSLCSERGFRPCRKAITPTLWERAGVMADRQGLPSLRSGCAGLQVSSYGNLGVRIAVMHGTTLCAQTLPHFVRKGVFGPAVKPLPRPSGRGPG